MTSSKPRFRPAKLRELALYFIQKCVSDHEFSMVKLHSLIYLAEMECYQTFGHTISNPTFIKRDWGIECKELESAILHLTRTGQIVWQVNQPYFSMA